jgi:hypothetical protein
MKRIVYLIAVLGVIGVSGCATNNNPRGGAYADNDAYYPEPVVDRYYANEPRYYPVDPYWYDHHRVIW